MNTLENIQIPKVVLELRKIFFENKDRRICVVGSSCVGKSTLLNFLPEAIDMDHILFGDKEKRIEPKLTQEEIEYVCGPWDEKVGQFMMQKAKENIQIEKGKPVFGTIVFDCDLVIEITVSDEILGQRVKARNANLQDVLNMKKQIEDEIEKSGKPKVVIENI